MFAPARLLKLCSVEGPARPPLAMWPKRLRFFLMAAVPRRGRQVGLSAGEGAPEGFSWSRPEGFSWSRAVAVPALGSACRVGTEEQAGRKTAEIREREVSQQGLVGVQQMEGACISREGFSSDAEGRQYREGSPPEGACNSREGFSTDAEGRQYREGSPPGVGSVALPGLRHDAPCRHGYQRGKAQVAEDAPGGQSGTLIRNTASGLVHAVLLEGQARCSWSFTVGITAEVVSSAPELHKDLCESCCPWLRGDR